MKLLKRYPYRENSREGQLEKHASGTGIDIGESHGPRQDQNKLDKPLSSSPPLVRSSAAAS